MFFKMGIKNQIKKISRCCVATSMIFFALIITACSKSERDEQIEAFSAEYAVAEENQLIVYTSHKEEVYLPIIREFESRTGIWVDVHAGGTAEMMEAARVASETGQCDIMFGGGVESYEAAKDIFLPYEVAEIDSLDSDFIDVEGYWTPFTKLPIVFVYNKNLVTESMAPSTWEDLFDTKWKGKIAFADMEKSGTSYTIISTMAQLFGEDPNDVLKKFYEQLDGNIAYTSGNVITEVSNGNCLIGITLEETALKAIDGGSNISMVMPEDGTSAVPDGVAIVQNAPHSYNAGKFIDFVINYDTQSYAMTQFNRRSVRTDIRDAAKFDELKLMDFDIAKSAAQEESVVTLWHNLVEDSDE